VVIVGMGGSAIAADLVQAFLAPLSHTPVQVWRNYDLPAFVNQKTLVMLSSHSGNTEEVLSGFERALEIGAKAMVLSTGGELTKRAEQSSIPLLRFVHQGQPRAAIGYSFGLLLAALSQLRLIADPSGELHDAVAEMRARQPELMAHVPVVQNPAKRLAGQLIDRWPLVIGADILAPIARRWRTQIAEIAKALAQFEELPEADHNLVAGVSYPEHPIAQTMVVFLRAASYHPRNLLRTDVTQRALMMEGFNTDVVEARGQTRLAQQWTTLHFGDYIAYYLAMAYGVDPTPVPAIQGLKRELEKN